MSAQDPPPEFDGEASEPEEVTVRRLVRAIDYAEGFWLGFAKSNTPAQRRRLSALCKDLLGPLRIRVLEIELGEPVTELLPVLRESLAREGGVTPGRKLALFVHGLERSIPSREAYPPLLSVLNLNRELFRQVVPHPLLLWLPDYALTALARKAPDFWAWRSGLYEFAPEREAAEQSLAALRGEAMHITESLPEQAKRERLVMLKGLLDDYHEMGDGVRERGVEGGILHEIGMTHQALGEWGEARESYEQSLAINRDLQNEEAEAMSLYSLAYLAQEQGDLEEARLLHGKALEIDTRLNNQSGIALNVWGLANISWRQGNLGRARELYQEALETFRTLDDHVNAAGILHQLGTIAQARGEFEEARRMYEESLKISSDAGDQNGVAYTVGQLGNLALAQGDYAEARRFYNTCLEISKRLGERNSLALALHQLGWLAETEGNKAEAARFISEALTIFERLGSPNAEVARRSLTLVQGGEDVPD